MNINHVIYICFFHIVYGFLNFKKHNIIKHINGFYGLIGPDIKTYTLQNYTSLHDVFSGNGIIQGVFFDKGKISFLNDGKIILNDDIQSDLRTSLVSHKIKNDFLNEKRQRYLVFHNQYFNFTK